MSRWATLVADSSSRPIRAQWVLCWAALRLIRAPTVFAAAYRSSSIRMGEVVDIRRSSRRKPQ